MTMMKKTIIHQFDTVIYPRKLWVMKGGSVDDILDAFTEPDGTEVHLMPCGGAEPGAMVIKVCHRETGFLGALVWLCSKDISVKDVTHEAVHVASCIFDDCNMTIGFDGGRDEHFAYLAGFAADCINQVRTNKFRI